MAIEVKTISLGFVNSYLVKTHAGFFLIDTGVPFSRAAIEESLAKAGCVAGNLKLIILTHGDVDHIGSCAALAEKYGAKVAMHEGDRAAAETGRLQLNRKVKSLFMKMMQGLMGRLGIYKKMMAGFKTFTPDIFLEDGQTLDSFGLDATVLHVPGHTPGSIAILADENLFSGDTILNRGKPSAATIVENEAELAKSIARLGELKVTRVYPGHGKPFAANGRLELK